MSSSKKVIIQSLLFALLAALVTAALGTSAFVYLAKDSCLDRGGSFVTEELLCKFGGDSPQFEFYAINSNGYTAATVILILVSIIAFILTKRRLLRAEKTAT